MVQSFKSVNSKWNYWMNNTFLWHCLLYNTSLSMTLTKILQCDYPSGGAQDFKRQGWSTEGKNQNPQNFQGCQHPTPPPPPPKKKKFTNFQALKIQTKKNPRPSIIPVSWNPEYPHCGDYTSKLFLVAFSPGESGGSTLQKSGG